MSPQCFDQALLSKVFSIVIERVSDHVRVECQYVSWKEQTFGNQAVPLWEQSQDSGSGIKPLKSVIAPKKKRGVVPTIHVAQAPSFIIVFGKEKRGIGAVGRVFIEQLVHRPQEPLRLIQSDCTLAPQVSLQVGHQESGTDPLSSRITD